jgi:hypothetical protein
LRPGCARPTPWFSPAAAADLLEIVLREVIHHEHDIEREVRHRDCERAS